MFNQEYLHFINIWIRPIIPVHISTGQVWNKNGFIKQPGIVEVKFLEKINKGLNKSEFLSIINNRLN